MDAFIGGGAMSSKLREMMEKLGIEATVRVGFLEGSTCGKDNDASAPNVAYINEFGAPEAHIPPRPFFRTAISINSARWGELLGASLKLVNYDSREAMGLVGMKISEQVQQSIEDFTDPANAESTIARKGFDDPLQDSKNMKRAVNFEVSE